MYEELFWRKGAKRRKVHSNRYKRLRRMSEAMSSKPNELRAKVHKIIRGGKEHKRLQAFWQYMCQRRLYKDMKREGWGGTIANLQLLVNQAMRGPIK